MKKVNRCYFLLALVLYLLFGTIRIFGQHNVKVQQPYYQSFGSSYLSLEANATTGKINNNFSNYDYFESYSSWSNTIDFTFGAAKVIRRFVKKLASLK